MFRSKSLRISILIDGLEKVRLRVVLPATLMKSKMLSFLSLLSLLFGEHCVSLFLSETDIVKLWSSLTCEILRMTTSSMFLSSSSSLLPSSVYYGSISPLLCVL